MKARRDNGIDTKTEEKDEFEAEDSAESAKVRKAKIKKYIQLTVGLIGVGFLIYNVIFAEQGKKKSGDGEDMEESSSKNEDSTPKKPDFGKEEIEIDRQQQSNIAKREVQEFLKSQVVVDNAKAPDVSAPSLPPLPDYKFTEQIDERRVDNNVKLNDNIKSQQDNGKNPSDKLPPLPKSPEVKKDTTLPPLPNLSAPPPSNIGVDSNNPNGQQTPTPNPDQIVAEKKNMNMFVFSNGSGSGGSSQSKKSSSKGDNDFIIYDKSKLIEVQKESQNDPKITVTQNKNMENFIGTGKIIDVVLETAINSQLPGMVRGIVAIDVFGELGSKILIPKGTRVYGSYTSTVLRGQSRLDVIWNKFIRPDGISVGMTGRAADQFGRYGIEGDVDNRYSEIFSNSLLLSFVNLGTAVALERVTSGAGQTQVVNGNGSVATTNINPVNTAAQSVIQNTSDIVKQLTEGAMTLQPIVTLPQGTRMKIIVNQDMTLPDYVKKKI